MFYIVLIVIVSWKICTQTITMYEALDKIYHRY